MKQSRHEKAIRAEMKQTTAHIEALETERKDLLEKAQSVQGKISEGWGRMGMLDRLLAAKSDEGEQGEDQDGDEEGQASTALDTDNDCAP